MPIDECKILTLFLKTFKISFMSVNKVFGLFYFVKRQLTPTMSVAETSADL